MPKKRVNVRLEDLIRLKRSERPSPEFWEDFEHELMLKQKLLLQQQPVGKLVLAEIFWANAKRVCAYGCAAATGGAFIFAGFVGFNTMQTASNDGTVYETQPIPTFAVAVSPQESIVTASVKTVRQNSNEQIAVAVTHTADHLQDRQVAENTISTADLASTLDLTEFDAEAFARSRPLKGLDIEEIVNFSRNGASSSPLARELNDKYLEPIGYLAASTDFQAQSNPQIQRASYRIDDQARSSRSSRFSEFTVRF